MMKMKKILPLALLFGATITFVGCAGEEDDLFDQSAAQRLIAAETVYSNRLTDAPAGWTMEYYPTYDSLGFKAKGYLMLANFKKDGSVLIAMNNAFSENKYLEATSLWEIITDNGPELSFNSYNACLHAFSSPEDLPSSINDSGDNVQGMGAEGDYEFVLVDVKEGANEINVKGKKRGTYVHMVKLDEDVTDYQAYLHRIDSLSSVLFPSSLPVYPILAIDTLQFDFTNAASGIVELYPVGGDPVTQTTHHSYIISYYGGAYHLRFRYPLDFGVSKAQDFVYNEKEERFVCNEGNAEIKGRPVIQTLQNLLIDGRTWQVRRVDRTRLSDEMYEYLRAINASLHNLSSLNFLYADGKFYWKLLTSQAEYEYDCSFNEEQNTIRMSYVGPKNTVAENVFNRTVPVQNLVNALSQDFVITACNSAFDLRTLRFTSVSTPDFWFELTIQ
ncbi:MAG: DUF4302 domain-containing protein [Prevotella sp.]|nr:DUF4302 domain-containing protein [Prevotella sp.]